MPATRTCTHGMPSPATCFECMEEGPVAPPPTRPAPPEQEGEPFPARYYTQCRHCNTAVHVGELIVRTTHGTYVHAEHYRTDAWGVTT